MYQSRSLTGRAWRIASPIMLVPLAASILGCFSDGSSTVSSKVSTTFAYITNAADNTVSAYSVSAKTGALSKITTYPTGHTPEAIAVLSIPNSVGYVYIVNRDDNTVSQYSFDRTGSLSPLNPPTVATGSQPTAILQAYGSGGANNAIFVANRSDSTISYFNVNSNGTLGSPVTFASGGTGPITLSTGGGNLFVLNSGDNSLCEFTYAAGSSSLKSKLSLPSSYSSRRGNE